jgi:hypothetical protein
MLKSIAGLCYIVHSPCLYELQGVELAIAFDGRSWLIGVHGAYGTHGFPSLAVAAAMVSRAFAGATAEELIG